MDWNPTALSLRFICNGTIQARTRVVRAKSMEVFGGWSAERDLKTFLAELDNRHRWVKTYILIIKSARRARRRLLSARERSRRKQQRRALLRG
jgi:hypothetical protein